MAAKKIMKIHPLCRMFSQIAPLANEEKAQMLESVKKHGIRMPILVNTSNRIPSLTGRPAGRWPTS